MTGPTKHSVVPASETPRFEPEEDTIRWKVHFRSPPEKVFQFLDTAEGRERFWAESAEEDNGVIQFHVPGDLISEGRILERVQSRRFVTEYFGWTVAFELERSSSDGGTDLLLTCSGFASGDRAEITSGWVSVLMAMKAAVDFGVDLRNHDPERTWWQGFLDN